MKNILSLLLSFILIDVVYAQTHFTIQQSTGCNTLQLNIQNNHPSNNFSPNPFLTTGFSYQWNFGNGQTSTLENPTANYSQPGTYTIHYDCTIDTVGFYLTGILVTQVNCNDPFGGAQDPYIIIKDVNDNTVFTTESNYINDQNPPYSWGFNIQLNNPPYFLWVWDYDSMDGNDNCVDDSENQPGVATVITLPANNSSTFGNTTLHYVNGGLIFDAYFYKPVTTYHDSATVTVYQSPNAPIISPNNLSYCLGEQAQNITATGNTNSIIRWYTDSLLTNVFAVGNSISPNTSQEGVFSYYVVQTDNITGCESNPSIAQYSVSRLASPIIQQNNITVCTGQVLQPIVAQGTYPLFWYADQNLTTLVNQGDTLYLQEQLPGTYQYYIVQKDTTRGCISTPTILTVNYIQGIEIQSTVNHVSCFGGNNGSIEVTITQGTAPFTHFWLHGPTELNLQNLEANEYVLTVMDQNQCLRMFSIFVNQPDSIHVEASITNVSCYGNADGAIELNVTGGTLPYNYQWNNGSTNHSINQLQANTYTITITDQHQCTKLQTYNIQQPDSLVTLAIINKETCNGKNDGSIVLRTWGGTPPYSLLWSNQKTDTLISNLHLGQYQVTITDNHNCSKVENIQLESIYDFCLDIPNVFTPNADGINDTWEIKFIEMYNNPTVIVFDNSGKKLYENTGVYEPWDGTLNGKKLPMGSYFYIIDLKLSDKEPFSGTLDIIY
ncbi:MAG: gliding motility-associated C-terminal domain-containing protein [Bacteroidales bacterium]|nr:gliding motility-associated C-terminal domain-containing protein [Bacteroidales bacterium]